MCELSVESSSYDGVENNGVFLFICNDHNFIGEHTKNDLDNEAQNAIGKKIKTNQQYQVSFSVHQSLLLLQRV